MYNNTCQLLDNERSCEETTFQKKMEQIRDIIQGNYHFTKRKMEDKYLFMTSFNKSCQ